MLYIGEQEIFRLVFTAAPVGSCGAVNINVPSPGAIFSQLTNGGGNRFAVWHAIVIAILLG